MFSRVEIKNETGVEASSSAGPARFREYIAIARPDHWTKNLFILPGLFLGKLVSGARVTELMLPLVIAMAATCLISSANYTINEWLDREFDQFHPKKRSRPSVSGRVRASGVYLQYAVLIIGGLGLSALINVYFVCAAVFLLVMGVLYNVRPFRTKDRAYLDVISESINNPIRLCMGWLITVPNALPPSTILLGYWFGGAFLMAVKRFAEFRTIGDSRTAGLYRKSFQTYTVETLLASAVFHAMAASLFLGVFLVKYRIELILSFPFVAGLFTWYLRMGMKENSAAQHPEKLLAEGRFMMYVVGLTILMGSLFVVDIPVLHKLLRVTFPEL
jgi:decaprenyl-phosphate phosphoribosyltransferase